MCVDRYWRELGSHRQNCEKRLPTPTPLPIRACLPMPIEDCEHCVSIKKQQRLPFGAPPPMAADGKQWKTQRAVMST